MRRAPLLLLTTASALLCSQWVAFVNDVGEGYMTFPPRGNGVELAGKKLWSEQGEWEGH